MSFRESARRGANKVGTATIAVIVVILALIAGAILYLFNALPGGKITITLDKTTYPTGGLAQVTGQGAYPNGTVQVSFLPAGSTTKIMGWTKVANAQGGWTDSFNANSNLGTGTATVMYTDLKTGRIAKQTFTVTSS